MVKILKTRYERKSFIIELADMNQEGVVVNDTYLNDIKERLFNIKQYLDKVVLVSGSMTKNPELEQFIQRLKVISHRPVEIQTKEVSNG